MSTDIRLSVDFFDHPKTGKLQRRCGVDGVVCLQRLWAWAAKNRPDGDLSGVDAEGIEIISRWPGKEGIFYQAVLEVGFVEADHKIHDWLEHNPWAAGAGSRSDTGRLNKMKGDYPQEHALFVEAGRSGISKADYERIKSSSNPLGTTQVLLKHYLTPSPSPKPKPKTQQQQRAREALPEVVELPTRAADEDRLREAVFGLKGFLLANTAVTDETFAVVAEQCVAHYAGKGLGIDPKVKILGWFKRERASPPVEQNCRSSGMSQTAKGLAVLDEIRRRATDGAVDCGGGGGRVGEVALPAPGERSSGGYVVEDG